MSKSTGLILQLLGMIFFLVGLGALITGIWWPTLVGTALLYWGRSPGREARKLERLQRTALARAIEGVDQ